MAISTSALSGACTDRPEDRERLPEVDQRPIIVERVLCQHPRREQRPGADQIGRTGDRVERAHDQARASGCPIVNHG